MQLVNGCPGIVQVQVLMPVASMPHETQQFCVQILPQLTLWQSEAQAPPATESGLSAKQSQLPGCAVQSDVGAAEPPMPLDVDPPAPVAAPPAPVPTPVEPPVPVAVLAEEHAKNTKLCASKAATPNVLS